MEYGGALSETIWCERCLPPKTCRLHYIESTAIIGSLVKGRELVAARARCCEEP